MLGIVGIVALLTVLGLSMIFIRLATVALTMTGLSRQSAEFQARSAFTGTGFTTAEAESIVRHPVRRRIIMWLMLCRGAGLATVVISMVLSFAGPAAGLTKLYRLLWLIGGVAILWIVAASRLVDRPLDRLMHWALSRWTDLDVRDYVRLLGLAGDYEVQELAVEPGDWIEGKDLSKCDLGSEGVLVLGIRRDNGDYVGAPRGSTEIRPGDTLIVYGRSDAMTKLGERKAGPAGDVAHERAKGEQEEHLRRQDAEERQRDMQRQSGQRPQQDEQHERKEPPERRPPEGDHGDA